MRSKCRCSHVLQFTFRHAVSCVLHRPPSQVIHCTVLFSNSFAVHSPQKSRKNTFKDRFTSHRGEGHGTNSRRGEDLWCWFSIPKTQGPTGAPDLYASHRRARGAQGLRPHRTRRDGSCRQATALGLAPRQPAKQADRPRLRTRENRLSL